MITIVQNN